MMMSGVSFSENKHLSEIVSDLYEVLYWDIFWAFVNNASYAGTERSPINSYYQRTLKSRQDCSLKYSYWYKNGSRSNFFFSYQCENAWIFIYWNEYQMLPWWFFDDFLIKKYHCGDPIDLKNKSQDIFHIESLRLSEF